jgi:hypothetical protein
VADTLGGGLLIERYASGSATNSCTLGIVADRSGTRGFITASHCSSNMYFDDGSEYMQPDSNSTDTAPAIGEETVDPIGTGCGLDVCRGSDATFNAVTSSRPARRGVIYSTGSSHRSSGQAGTVAVASPPKWINIRAGETSLLAGLAIDKMGMWTGWTYGSITGTCVDYTINGPPGNQDTITCAGRASLWAHTGDSGSPVFWWDGNEGAYYYGVLGALNCSCNQLNDSFFSSYQQTNGDLVGLNVASEITVGAPVPSGSVNGSGQPVTSWSAVSTTNTSETTSYIVWSSAWNASVCNWLTTNAQVDSTTSTSATDSSEPFSVSSYAGSSAPDGNTYSFIQVLVLAYNSGILTFSTPIYFQGAANGAGGTSCNGGGGIMQRLPPRLPAISAKGAARN